MKKPNKLEGKVVEILTPFILEEYTAAMFYTQAGNWSKDKGYMKAAAFFYAEAKAEMEHSHKLQTYLVDWNVMPTLPAIPAPPSEFKDMVDIISQSYDIEYQLYEKYEKSSLEVLDFPDPCTFDFLQEFRTIQRESVAEYADMLNILDGVEPTKINILLLEEELFGE